MAPRGRKKQLVEKPQPKQQDDEATTTTRSMMTRRSQSRAAAAATTTTTTTKLKSEETAPEPKRMRIDEGDKETSPVEKPIDDEKTKQEEKTEKQVTRNEVEDKPQPQPQPQPARPQTQDDEEEKKKDNEGDEKEEPDGSNETTTSGGELNDSSSGERELINEAMVPQTTTFKLVDPPPAEVFTEATLIAEVNRRLLQNASSSNVLTNPLNQDTSSDSSDSDGAETDEYNDDSGSGSKKSRSRSSNGSHKTGTANGVLNKSKIDTEFIAKLIPNKDPNDKRYDLNEINKLRLLSHSYQNFSVKLLTRLFDEEEIIGRNVYGRNYSGDKTATKLPLDPERINFIKETVLRLTKTNNPELAWASCVIAMNRKMVDINNKYMKLKMMMQS